MPLPALSRSQSRCIDQLAIDQLGMPGMVLMENAGRGVVDVLLRVDPTLNSKHSQTTGSHIGEVSIFCGKGNNAGDGFVIARHLEIRGIPVQVLLLAAPQELRGDARLNFEILTHTDIPRVNLWSCKDLKAALEKHVHDSTWLVDALLGTGAQGAPREPYRTTIEWMNGRPARRLAVDLPSGLDCDTGQPAAPTLHADLTCTFVAPKIGFQAASARSLLGQVHVVSIGLPDKWLRQQLLLS
jgi:NAD(P)H-hydrate epimerase